MNRLATGLSVLVGALSVVCIALIIVLAVQPPTQQQIQIDATPSQLQSNTKTKKQETEEEKYPVGVDVQPILDNPRLPKHVLPEHYHLHLHPNLETGLFTGKVRIDMITKKPVNYFLSHIQDLTISKTYLTDNQGNEIRHKHAFEVKVNQYWVVYLEDQVQPGNYSLHLEFAGNLTRGITGFYLSRYTNAAGEKVPIATSKFQPTYARKAFPCFDEPSFKSTFTTKLVKPSARYIALSNMPEESQRANLPSTGLTTVTFQKSVPMVTYLACFIVCDFEFQEKLTAVHKTKFRVYATPQQKQTVKYALDIGSNITDFFTNYFDLPYPLPKQDMIAIPDFVSGAMEHWGLITYRETNLLFDAKESSTYNQQRVASVVSHELAHQWFGNLVTLEWWDDLWLNEGFASYMEYKGVANYHDDWEIEDQFISTDLQSVMKLDSTVNSHPIVQDVSHPDQITEIFDAISYNKGASVLRMLENFMGPEEFRRGIHLFLKKYQYSNAVTADLWRELEAVSSKKLAISSIMDTWTRQMGYPVLDVEKISSTRYKVTQTRYLSDQTAKVNISESPFQYRWDVPVTWVTDTASTPTLRWLNRDESMLEVNLPEGTNWVKFNVGQFGYYRVNYEASEWDKLAQVLESNPSALQSTDRASLLNDAFSLAQSGHISYSVPLSMTKYMQKEQNLVPWETVFDTLVQIIDLLRYTETYPLFQNYIQDLVRSRYREMGWDDTGSHADKLNRYNILSLACRSGLQECLDKAASLFTTWITDVSTYISPNLRTTVYKYGMQGTGDWKTWSAMFKRYLNEENPQEKKKLMYGLSQTKEPWILKRFLELAKNESNVRSQDYFSVLQLVNLNPVGSPLAWEYLREEWDYLVDRFTLNDRYLGRTVKYMVEDFTTEFQLNQVDNFFLENPESGAGSRSRKQALEKIKLNIKWLKDHRVVLHNWLLNRQQL